MRRWLLAVGLLSTTSSLQAQEITLSEVLQQVVRAQPAVALAELNEAQQRLKEQDRQAMLDGQWSVRLQGSDEKKPSTSPFGPNITNVGLLSADVSKPLVDGSRLNATLSYSRTRLRYPAATSPLFQATMNPVYESKIDVTYTYPLLQGRGNPAYHLQEAVNQRGIEAARYGVAQRKEALIQQAIAAFFQLRANELSLHIADDAVHRAEQLLRYQRKRERFGLLEKADRLQTEALLAARRASQVQAAAALHSSQTALSRLLLKQGEDALHARLTANDPLLQPLRQNDDALLKQAEARRPVFRQLAAQLAAAQAAEPILEDKLKPQLNIFGQLGSRALSGLNSKTFNDSFDLRDRYVGIGIEWRDDIGNHASKAALARNALQRDQIMLQRWQTLEQLRTDLATARTDLYNARQNSKAAQARVAAERRKYQAELARYSEGRADTATIIQFSGELRSAELQAALQALNIALATVRLRFLAGMLLPE